MQVHRGFESHPFHQITRAPVFEPTVSSPSRRAPHGPKAQNPGFESHIDVKRIHIEMRQPKGAQASGISKYSDAHTDERETLVARNSVFKALSFDKKSKKLVIEMSNEKQKPNKGAADSAPQPQQPPASSTENRFVWDTGAGIVVSPGDDAGEIVLTLADLDD